ncbi:AAA family ATPase [Enterococcus hulanensis]|uniref:AAA family ATPase n=1 Tax=Enterococcus hulanensis TaxID=2559929 RepID=UPI001A8C223D|nr:AAA family ATPase [Enterococcus hulanensis]MBO0456645.1 AAA family ATPase [Enterococcus hulanensis]
MKKLVLISGTMGIGKSTITKIISDQTENSVYLDGDWCWMMNPFIVNDENKAMVTSNIQFLLNSFIENSMIKTIFFCWVMDEQAIVDTLLNGIHQENIKIVHISLIASEKKLSEHIIKDIDAGKRTHEDLKNSIERLHKYEQLNSTKLDISNLTIPSIAYRLKQIVSLY